MAAPQIEGGHPVESTIHRFSSLIKSCIGTSNLRLGRVLHSHLIKTSLNHHALLANRLVTMYARCSSLDSARAAFHDLPKKNSYSWNALLSALVSSSELDAAQRLLGEMTEPNAVSYNSVISGLNGHRRYEEAIDVFRQMRGRYGDGVVMDEITVVGVASACAGMGELRCLRQLHAGLVVTPLNVNRVMGNAIIGAYGKCGDADSSCRIFDQMPESDIVSWTSLVGAYTDVGRLGDALRVFDRMPVKNVVSWTALISGHVKNGAEETALELFGRMIEEGVHPNQYTFVSVLNVCANLALLGAGKQVHGYLMRRYGLVSCSDLFMCNALIDVYAKCGSMGSAMMVFEMMPKRDVVSWNSVVSGFAHGKGKQSLAIFENMRKEVTITPNCVTFLAVLSACNHAGLTSESQYYFDMMRKEYGIRPRREHYASLVDLLGRSHHLEEAVELLECLPDGRGMNDVRCWGSILAASRVHGNVGLAKRAAELLFTLEPENVGRHVMLSNIYAAAGRWDDSGLVRGVMRDKGMMKEPACSWIEVKNVRHVFVTKDKSHPRREEIYRILCKLVDQIKESSEHFSSSGDLYHLPGD